MSDLTRARELLERAEQELGVGDHSAAATMAALAVGYAQTAQAETAARLLAETEALRVVIGSDPRRIAGR